MSETNLTIANLSAASAIGDTDLLLLRSGVQDYKLPVEILATRLLAADSGAGRVGISEIGGMYADTVQEALEELCDRTDNFIGNAVAHIYAQIEQTSVYGDAVVVPNEEATVGSNFIPVSHWQRGACAELDFEFIIQFTPMDEDDVPPPSISFIPTLAGQSMVEGTTFALDLPSSFTGLEGRGSFRMFYQSGTLSDPLFQTRMEAKTVKSGSAHDAVTLHAVKFSSINGPELTSGASVGLNVDFDAGYSGLSFSIRNARIFWHPAPQALA